MFDALRLERSLLLPAAAALVMAVLLCWGPAGRRRAAVAGPVAFLTGVAALWISLRGVPRLPPSSATEWTLWFVAAATLRGLAEVRRPAGPWVRRLDVLLAGALLSWCVFERLVPHAWSDGRLAAGVAVGTLAVACAWGVPAERARNAAVRWEAFLGPFLVAPAVLVRAGTVGQALLVLGAGAALLGTSVGVRWAGSRPGRPLIGPVALALLGPLAVGVGYASLPASAALLLAGTPALSCHGRTVATRIASAALGLGLSLLAWHLTAAAVPPYP